MESSEPAASLLAVPDPHNPPPGYAAPIVCDGLIALRDVRCSKTVAHRVYHDEQHPSHLALPIIPLG